MLEDLFSNRLFIGVLALFVLCVVGGTLYQQHVERQTVREIAETDDRLKTWTEKHAPNSTAEAPVAETSQGEHFHEDGTLHAAPHETSRVASDEVEVPELSEAEMEARKKEIREQMAQRRADYITKWGEPPSPDASYQHFRDNHGNVHRHYRGTVAISDYEFRTMFAPTLEELERYKQLRAALKDATSADANGSWENPSPEVQRLGDKIKSLVDSAQREIPHPFGFRYHGEPNSGFLSPASEKMLDAIAIRDFYQRFEMEYLYELHNEPTKFYQKY